MVLSNFIQISDAKAMEHDFKPQRSLVPTISDAEEPFVHPQLLRQGDYFFDQKLLILVKPGNSDLRFGFPIQKN